MAFYWNLFHSRWIHKPFVVVILFFLTSLVGIESGRKTEALTIFFDFKIGIALVGRPLDDLCVDIWTSVMSQHPDTRETGYSNVLGKWNQG